MGDKSKISWTDATWNPLVGCTRVSEGCRNCYAERLAATRLKDVPAYQGIARVNGSGEPRWTGEVRIMGDRLEQPRRWKRPRMIFVNSMSDLFHESVEFSTIATIFGAMAVAPQHRFQVLTKRPERMRGFFRWMEEGDRRSKMIMWVFAETGSVVPWPLPNVWLGVSVEDQATANERIPLLLETPAAVRWISAEPLLGPVVLPERRLKRPTCGFCDDYGHSYQDPTALCSCTRRAIDPRIRWVVVGGESGPYARPMHPEWVRSLRDQCTSAGVPYHFKQWGEWVPQTQNFAALTERTAETALYVAPNGSTRPARWGARGDSATVQRVGKRAAGRRLDGRTWDEYPAMLEEEA